MYDPADSVARLQGAEPLNPQVNFAVFGRSVTCTLENDLMFNLKTTKALDPLILNMNIYVRDASSGATIAAMSADMRGNTDECGHAHSTGWFTIGFSRLAMASSTK